MAAVAKRPSFAEFYGGKEPKTFIFEDEQVLLLQKVPQVQFKLQSPDHYLRIESLREYRSYSRTCVVFEEKVNKQAPIHFLVVPKKVIPSLIEASMDDKQLLGHMFLIAKQVAIEKGLDRTGYHVMVDEHHESKRLKSLHIFGRALHHMLWPVGPGCRL